MWYEINTFSYVEYKKPGLEPGILLVGGAGESRTRVRRISNEDAYSLGFVGI